MRKERTMSDFVTVAKTSKIRKGRGKAFTVNGKRIAVFNADDENFYALDNACAHALGPLGRGRVRNGAVVCPVHSYAYDITDGSCLTDARLRVRSYEVIVEDDEIKVKC
jgi:nitrite reductase/ring-hydroxylating ferredoxin subunit